MEAESAPLQFQYDRFTDKGRIRLVVRSAGQAIFVEVFNVLQDTSRKRIATSLTERIPVLSFEDAMKELDVIAAQVVDTPPADPIDILDSYRAEADGIYWDKPGPNGTTPVRLTNFVARIVEVVEIDDGAVQLRLFEIDVEMGGVVRRLTVAAPSFASMNWVLEQIGAAAIVFPGIGLKDQTRAAIQILSGTPPMRLVYGHTGWREIKPHGWCFLHAEGAVGPDGPVPEVQVQLPTELNSLALPAPPTGAELIEAIGAVLGPLMDLAVARVIFPCIAALARVVLAPVSFAIYLAGKSGTFKTEVAATLQSSFGKTVDAEKLPGSWSSTGNALEALSFRAKDMVFVVDDFAPSGSAADVQRFHREADRLLRAQGNRRGRTRMAADSQLKPSYYPRGMILSTGEDVPAGQSLRARMVIIEMAQGDITSEKLSRCQEAARNQQYAMVMAAYVKWLASQIETIRQRLWQRVRDLRAEFSLADSHRRTPTNVAELLAGFEVFMDFFHNAGAIDDGQREHLLARCRKGLLENAAAQARHHEAFDPVEVFLRLLRSAIAAGEAHIANKEGKVPSESVALALGWECGSESQWRARGNCVGWIVGDDLYLEPSAAHKAAQRMGGDIDRMSVTLVTLGKRLDERQLLLSKDVVRDRLQARRQLQGARRDVWHVSATLLGIPAQPAQSAQEPDGSLRDPEIETERAATDETTGPETGPPASPARAVGIDSGPVGPEGPESHTGGGAGATKTPLPPSACRSCFSTRYWRRKPAGPWTCGSCYAPGIEAPLIEWSDDGSAVRYA